jgi:hypothetical protein
MSNTSIALGLSRFVPDIIGWIAGDKAEKVATDVVSIAEKVTGKKGGDALDAINENPELALEFHKALMADRANARDTYKVHNEASDRIAHGIMQYNIWIVCALVLADVVACIFLADHAAVLTVVSTSTGFVIQSLLKERQDVTGFFYGSSIGSKMKTMTGMK